MNKFKAFLPMLFLTSYVLVAQDLVCNGDRYLNKVFTEVDLVEDIRFGQASTFGGKSQELLMDVYAPHEDEAALRPLVIMAHGGSFVGGDRSQTAEFCRDFALRGYVVANMEYRLLDALVFDSVGLAEIVIMATNDMRAAVRYFKEDAENANTHKISGDAIFVAGVSAGAIMASHLGFLDPNDEVPGYLQAIIDKHGGFEGNSSDNTQYSSVVQGVLNYSGGLMRSAWIDSDDAPVYSAHDDLDPTVPCSYNYSNIIPFPVYIYGSCDIKTAADEMKIANQLYLVSNSTGHVSYFSNESSKTQVLQESAAFLKSVFCGETSKGPVEFTTNDPGVIVYPNPFSDILHIDSDVEIQAISVHNLMGQSILKNGILPGNQMDLGNLPPGVYLIWVQTELGKSIIKAVKK